MKKVIVIVLFIGVLVSGYFAYNAICDNMHVKNKISIISNNILKNEEDKERYESKLKELEEIRENNKEKSSKYDEVEVWNQEIVKYLD